MAAQKICPTKKRRHCQLAKQFSMHSSKLGSIDGVLISCWRKSTLFQYSIVSPVSQCESKKRIVLPRAALNSRSDPHRFLSI